MADDSVKKDGYFAHSRFLERLAEAAVDVLYVYLDGGKQEGLQALPGILGELRSFTSVGDKAKLLALLDRKLDECEQFSLQVEAELEKTKCEHCPFETRQRLSQEVFDRLVREAVKHNVGLPA